MRFVYTQQTHFIQHLTYVHILQYKNANFSEIDLIENMYEIREMGLVVRGLTMSLSSEPLSFYKKSNNKTKKTHINNLNVCLNV